MHRVRVQNSPTLQRKAQQVKYILNVRISCVSYDFAKQLSIPMLANQTVNGWFAQINGYDINTFSIVDEGIGEHLL